MHKETTSIDKQTSIDKAAKSPALGLRHLGLGLILLSGVCFFSILSVPWWPLPAVSRTGIAAVLFVSVQVAWWLGAALAGPAVIGKMKSVFSRR
jgi:hypothetical protein